MTNPPEDTNLIEYRLGKVEEGVEKINAWDAHLQALQCPLSWNFDTKSVGYKSICLMTAKKQ